MARLCGISKPPKQPHAYHLFHHENWETGLQLRVIVEAAWKKISDEALLSKDADFGQRIVDSVWLKLDDARRRKYAAIEPALVRAVDELWGLKGKGRKTVTMGTEFVRKIFKELPEEERGLYAIQAREKGAASKAAYEKTLSEPPSKAPPDRKL